MANNELSWHVHRFSALRLFTWVVLLSHFGLFSDLLPSILSVSLAPLRGFVAMFAHKCSCIHKFFRQIHPKNSKSFKNITANTIFTNETISFHYSRFYPCCVLRFKQKKTYTPKLTIPKINMIAAMYFSVDGFFFFKFISYIIRLLLFCLHFGYFHFKKEFQSLCVMLLYVYYAFFSLSQTANRTHIFMPMHFGFFFCTFWCVNAIVFWATLVLFLVYRVAKCIFIDFDCISFCVFI